MHVYVCMYVCMYVCIYIYIYIYSLALKSALAGGQGVLLKRFSPLRRPLWARHAISPRPHDKCHTCVRTVTRKEPGPGHCGQSPY